jgi:hypothetical protein
VARFQVVILPFVLDGPDFIRINVLVCFNVFGDGIVRPRTFPESKIEPSKTVHFTL